jgi:hypothetical protein
MATVYIETTIPSYLTARPSRDLVTAAHQQITHDWWDTATDRFDIYVSDAVLEEIQRGDPTYAAKRMEIVAELQVLSFTTDVGYLIREYAARFVLGGSAATDLSHFAYSVAYNMDYLVTWSCRHIANGQIIKRLATANRDLGRRTPVIVTPEELLIQIFEGDE